jgi:DNA-binding IclR family transcriptional regulator
VAGRRIAGRGQCALLTSKWGLALMGKVTSLQGNEPRRIKSIEVGFRTIRILEAAGGFLPLVRIAALAGMPSSKAYIYLASFVREGLVQQDPRTGHYGLGPFSVQLGLAAIKNLDVVAGSRDVVDSLRDLTGCGVSLAVWGNRGPSLILKADGEGQGALGLRLGHVFWPTTSASGRVFLAFLPKHETAEAVRLERQIRGKMPGEALRDVLDRTRGAGYADSHGPTAQGRTAMAAPIFDFSGKIVASLAILVDEARDKNRVLSALLASASESSRRLGHRKPPASPK